MLILLKLNKIMFLTFLKRHFYIFASFNKINNKKGVFENYFECITKLMKIENTVLRLLPTGRKLKQKLAQ